MICPIMSKAVSITSDYNRNTDELIRIKCQGKDCALWVVEIPNGVLEHGQKPIEHCGLVK